MSSKKLELRSDNKARTDFFLFMSGEAHCQGVVSLMTSIFEILKSSAARWYQDGAPRVIFFLRRIYNSQRVIPIKMQVTDSLQDESVYGLVICILSTPSARSECDWREEKIKVDGCVKE